MFCWKTERGKQQEAQTRENHTDVLQSQQIHRWSRPSLLQSLLMVDQHRVDIRPTLSIFEMLVTYFHTSKLHFFFKKKTYCERFARNCCHVTSIDGKHSGVATIGISGTRRHKQRSSSSKFIGVGRSSKVTCCQQVSNLNRYSIIKLKNRILALARTTF